MTKYCCYIELKADQHRTTPWAKTDVDVHYWCLGCMNAMTVSMLRDNKDQISKQALRCKSSSFEHLPDFSLSMRNKKNYSLLHLNNLFCSVPNAMGQMPHETQHTFYIRHPLLSALLVTGEKMSLLERIPMGEAHS